MQQKKVTNYKNYKNNLNHIFLQHKQTQQNNDSVLMYPYLE